MKKALEYTDATIRLWLSAFQTGDLLKMCTERLLNEHGITTEQYDVLVSVKYLGDRVNITDVAGWLRRSTNTISMIVDRMVKAGLVRRARDRVDRRVVYLSITGKGEGILEGANPALWEVIKQILSPLSREDRGSFLTLFDVIDREALTYLNPGRSLEAVIRKREELHKELIKRLPAFALVTAPEDNIQRGKKGKTVRRG